jgi:hypothetical protein
MRFPWFEKMRRMPFRFYNGAKTRAIAAWGSASMMPIYDKLGGRSWILVGFFALAATVLAWYGKLTDSYAAVITALSGFHIGRAIAQDYHDRKMSENGNGNGNHSVSPPAAS